MLQPQFPKPLYLCGIDRSISAYICSFIWLFSVGFWSLWGVNGPYWLYNYHMITTMTSLFCTLALNICDMWTCVPMIQTHCSTLQRTATHCNDLILTQSRNNDYITCNNDYVTCNNDYVTCNNDYVTCNNDYIYIDDYNHKIPTPQVWTHAAQWLKLQCGNDYNYICCARWLRL